MTSKTKKLMCVLLGIIALGIIIAMFFGLNKGVAFSEMKQVKIYVAKDINLDEIKAMAEEIFENEKVIVHSVELFNDEFAITTSNITDEQIERLVNITNERYNLTNGVEGVDIITLPAQNIMDSITPYIVPLIIVLAITLVYLYIRFRKNNLKNVMINSILSVIIIEALYFSAISIIRIPVNEFTMPVALLILVATLTIVQFRLEEKHSV